MVGPIDPPGVGQIHGLSFDGIVRVERFASRAWISLFSGDPEELWLG